MYSLVKSSQCASSVPPRRQQGVALLMALVLLLALSMLAVSSMQGTLMQERMSVNQRDLTESFNAAEIALRAGEATLMANPLGFVGAAPLAVNPFMWNPPQDTNDPSWVGATAVPGPANVFRNPVFHIAEAGVICPPGGDSSSVCDELYVVTASGVGRQAGTFTVLQSTVVIQP